MIKKEGIYRHKENDSLYLILTPSGKLKVKEDMSGWLNCVVYREVNSRGSLVSDDIFVRSVTGFERDFQFEMYWSDLMSGSADKPAE